MRESLDSFVAARAIEQMKLVQRMAGDLRRLNATGNERDAIRALSALSYRMGDVAALAEDALFEARQAAVTEIVRKG